MWKFWVNISIYTYIYGNIKNTFLIQHDQSLKKRFKHTRFLTKLSLTS